jgi:hypothetical protein
MTRGWIFQPPNANGAEDSSISPWSGTWAMLISPLSQKF